MSRIIGVRNDSVEWWTPARLVERARRVMGSIDLDPATCEAAQRIVKANAYFTEAEDGLSLRWWGNVFLNPPYGNGMQQSKWSKKLQREYEASNVKQATLLVNANLGYDWFNELFYNYTTCLVRKRISFVPGSGQESDVSKRASAFVYFGGQVEEFADVFGDLGKIVY